MLNPYVGVRQGVDVGTEKTSKVDIDRESLPLTQGFVGAAYTVWKLGFSAEYSIADVNTFALVIGFHPRTATP